MISARELAFEVLSGVSRDGAYANLLLTKLQNEAGLESRDSALAQELAFGAIRWRNFYELIIEQCSGRPLVEIDQAAQMLLLLGCHQLLATRIPAHAAISETVELSKRHLNPGGVGFVNGVLRRVSEKSFNTWQEIMQARTKSRIEMLSVKHAHPVWIIKAFEQALALDGLEAQLEDLLELDNVPAQVNVVSLPGLCMPEELVAQGLEPGTASPLGFTMKSGNPSNLKAIKEGRARVQDQGSQLVALALIEAKPIKNDEQWLDICAGPGGKAALLAALAITAKAELTCNEIAAHRSKLVESALNPINPNIYVRTGDGRDLGDDAPEAFDRISLDAPCTGIGSLRRKPEARWTKSTEDIPELVQLQKQLLESAWNGLKPGGVLAYSTCSPHVSETIAVIDWLLKTFPKASLLDAQQVLKRINPGLEFQTKRNTAQLWTTMHGTDSMFLALISKPIG